MSKSLFLKVCMLVTIAFVVACSSNPRQPAIETEIEAKDTPKSVSMDSVVSESPLTSDVVYAVLVGEIAAQRGMLDTASLHYRLAAKLSRDPRAAERAARLAVFMNGQEEAVEAIEMWVQLEPDNPVAHQLAALFYARARRTDIAVDHLHHLVRLAQEDRLNGFMQAIVVIRKLKDEDYGLELMRELVSAYPTDPAALYSYAVVGLAAGHYEEAEFSVREALESDPGWSKASILLARILEKQGDEDGALSVLGQAVEAHPDDAGLRSAYGRQLVEASKLDRAYEQFAVLLENNPNNPDLMFSAGVVALQLDRSDVARTHLKALVDEGTRRSDGAYFLGQIEELEGNREAALHWYGQVSGAYESDADIRRARLLGASGDIQSSRDILQRLRVQSPEQAVKLYLVEAEILREAKRSAELMQLYAAALEAYPNNADLLYDRALYSVDLGRLDILERDLNRIIENDPDHADALNALGYTLADMTSRYAEALVYIERALALQPENAAILDSMGWVQYRLGNNQTALEYLRRALATHPDAEIAAHLGEVLWVMGEHDEARKIWQDALVTQPKDKFHQRLQMLIEHGPQVK